VAKLLHPMSYGEVPAGHYTNISAEPAFGGNVRVHGCLQLSSPQ